LFIAVAAAAVAGWQAYALREARKPPSEAEILERFRAPMLSRYRDEKYDFTINAYGYTWKGRTGDVMDDTILCFGAFEKHMLFMMRDYLKHFPDKDTVYLDVGCNAGQHTFILAPYVKTIHAFDPYPPAMKRLREMIELNKVTNVEVHEVGLGNKEAVLPMYEGEPDNTGDGTFREAWGKEQGGKIAGNFKVVVADDYLRPYKPTNVRLIKIDVQGFEQFVLEGMKEILAQNRPLVSVEVARPPRGSIASMEDLKKVFPENYEFLYLVTEPRHYVTGEYTLEEFSKVSDWFFANGNWVDIVAYPKEKEALVQRKREAQVPK
jgi:FkbM family methyltransferase